MSATSASLSRLLFLLRPFIVLMKQTRQVAHTVKQSILLRCLWSGAFGTKLRMFSNLDTRFNCRWLQRQCQCLDKQVLRVIPRISGTNVIKLFLFIIYEWDKYIRRFVPFRPFWPCLVFEGKDRSLPKSGAPEWGFTLW